MLLPLSTLSCLSRCLCLFLLLSPASTYQALRFFEIRCLQYLSSLLAVAVLSSRIASRYIIILLFLTDTNFDLTQIPPARTSFASGSLLGRHPSPSIPCIAGFRACIYPRLLFYDVDSAFLDKHVSFYAWVRRLVRCSSAYCCFSQTWLLRTPVGPLRSYSNALASVPAVPLHFFLSVDFFGLPLTSFMPLRGGTPCGFRRDLAPHPPISLSLTWHGPISHPRCVPAPLHWSPCCPFFLGCAVACFRLPSPPFRFAFVLQRGPIHGFYSRWYSLFNRRGTPDTLLPVPCPLPNRYTLTARACVPARRLLSRPRALMFPVLQSRTSFFTLVLAMLSVHYFIFYFTAPSLTHSFSCDMFVVLPFLLVTLPSFFQHLRPLRLHVLLECFSFGSHSDILSSFP